MGSKEDFATSVPTCQEGGVWSTANVSVLGMMILVAEASFGLEEERQDPKYVTDSWTFKSFVFQRYNLLSLLLSKSIKKYRRIVRYVENISIELSERPAGGGGGGPL